jgi:Flp pilus assembly pilin Flp
MGVPRLQEMTPMAHVLTAIARLARRTDGQDLIEYGLLAALIAIVAMAGVTTLGGTIYNVFWRAIGQAAL